MFILVIWMQTFKVHETNTSLPYAEHRLEKQLSQALNKQFISGLQEFASGRERIKQEEDMKTESKTKEMLDDKTRNYLISLDFESAGIIFLPTPI